MPYVVSLESYTPGQRYDDLPWTGAFLKESASRTGTYTTRETVTFDDPDADPTDPATRNFTTDSATLQAGWWKVVFFDAAGSTQETLPHYFPHPGARPSLEDIASILWARMKDLLGNVGAFSDDTRPTSTQVERLIDESVSDVAMRAGLIPEGLEDIARSAAALRTAAAIERSYFPEQSNDDNSAYALFREDYLELIGRVTEASIDPSTGSMGVVSVPVLGSNAFDPLTGEVLVYP